MENKEIEYLMCQVPGCEKRWTVNMGWRKCAEHAWGTENSNQKLKATFFDKPPVKPFTEVDKDYGPY